jgi:ATP/maltotriose-dependent transcriptional regulator MalT
MCSAAECDHIGAERRHPAPLSGPGVLLATKLHVLRPPPGFVPRRRLVEALGEGLARGRVLVSAPAGFGKTALLAGWARGDGRPVAWLGLDGGDSDPTRFWRYAVAALDRARPGLAGRMGPLLPRSVEGLVTALINELAADPGPDEVLLVPDDYHLIDSEPVHESVAFLLENLPPGLRVVVLLPPSLFEHPAAELSVDDSAQLGGIAGDLIT